MGIYSQDDGDEAGSMTAYVACGVRCGLSIAETLHAPVGFVMDLWEIFQKTHIAEEA